MTELKVKVQKGLLRRAAAVAMSVCLGMTLLPTSVLAEGDAEGKVKSISISAENNKTRLTSVGDSVKLTAQVEFEPISTEEPSKTAEEPTQQPGETEGGNSSETENETNAKTARSSDEPTVQITWAIKSGGDYVSLSGNTGKDVTVTAESSGQSQAVITATAGGLTDEFTIGVDIEEDRTNENPKPVTPGEPVVTPGEPTVESITISPNNATLVTSGQTATLKAELEYARTPDDPAQITWKIESGSTSVGFSNNATTVTGTTATVIAKPLSGSARISATAGGKTAYATITVEIAGQEDQGNQQAPDVPVSSVTLSDKTIAFDTIGKTYTLKATVNPTTATDQTVKWESSKPSVASVSSTGVVTAVGNGTAAITATAGGKSATATVTVSQKTTGLSITLNDQAVKGKTLKSNFSKKYTLKAVVTPTNADAKNAKVTWSTSNKKIAAVTAKGVVSIKKKKGKVKITAKTGDGRTASVTFNVSKGALKVTKIKITGTKAMKTSGKLKTQTLKAVITPVTADNQKLTWKSSNTKVATVSAKGKVTAKKKGKVTITATAKDGSKKKATFKITIK